MINVRGYLEYLGDIMSNVGDILSTAGILSAVWDIMGTLGEYNLLLFECRGGYHE